MVRISKKMETQEKDQVTEISIDDGGEKKNSRVNSKQLLAKNLEIYKNRTKEGVYRDGMKYLDFINMVEKKRQDECKENDKQWAIDKKAQDAVAALDAFLMKSVSNLKIESLSEREGVPFWIDTNCLALNWIIGNSFSAGLPGTKTILIVGEPGKGKSLLLDVFLGENIKKFNGVSYKCDIEDASRSEFTAKVVGSEEIANRIKIVSTKNFSASTKTKDRVLTIEKLNTFLNMIINHQISNAEKARIKSVCVGIDSVTQLTSIGEFDKNVANKEKKDMTSFIKIRELFRVITQQQRAANMTLIGLAQFTANVGANPLAPKKVINSKGSGFRYASSLTLEATVDREISREIKGGASIPIGIKMHFKTTKNRVEFKGRDAWLYFYFNSGVDRYGGLIELLTQYGVFSASAKPNQLGEYADTVKFKWSHPDTKETYIFKQDMFTKFMQELDNDTRDEFLKIWEKQLNEVYYEITKDWDEAILLEDDEISDGEDEYSELNEDNADDDEPEYYED